MGNDGILCLNVCCNFFCGIFKCVLRGVGVNICGDGNITVTHKVFVDIDGNACVLQVCAVSVAQAIGNKGGGDHAIRDNGRLSTVEKVRNIVSVFLY